MEQLHKEAQRAAVAFQKALQSVGGVNPGAELEKELRGFIGTECYYRHWTGRAHWTDGVQYLAEKAKAHWLIDAVISHQLKKHVRACRFQIWQLKIRPDQTARLQMREDTGEPVKAYQNIDYSDFPIPEFELYFIDNILLLKSEY